MLKNNISPSVCQWTYNFLNELSFGKVEASIADHWKCNCTPGLFIIRMDVTDTCYSGSKTESKNGKVSKLLQIGLIVSYENSLPLLHRI
jgi:hypothetical protein